MLKHSVPADGGWSGMVHRSSTCLVCIDYMTCFLFLIFFFVHILFEVWFDSKYSTMFEVWANCQKVKPSYHLRWTVVGCSSGCSAGASWLGAENLVNWCRTPCVPPETPGNYHTKFLLVLHAGKVHGQLEISRAQWIVLPFYSSKILERDRKWNAWCSARV